MGLPEEVAWNRSDKHVPAASGEADVPSGPAEGAFRPCQGFVRGSGNVRGENAK